MEPPGRRHGGRSEWRIDAVSVCGDEHRWGEPGFTYAVDERPLTRHLRQSVAISGPASFRYTARRSPIRGTVIAWRIPAEPGTLPAVGNRPKVVISEGVATGRGGRDAGGADVAGGVSETNEPGCAPPAAHPGVETIPAGVFQVFLRIFEPKV